MNTLSRLTVVAVISLLAACGTIRPDLGTDLTERELYEEARLDLEKRNFVAAQEKLEQLESLFPFGRFAEQAQLDLIYARYSLFDIEGARSAADRFIRLHPRNPQVDYAYYVRGLALFNADLGLILRFAPVDESARDPGAAREAFSTFQELITRFPDSDYAPDARARMVYIRNRLAAYQLHVARYYIKREAFVAAANRARYVVESFTETPAVPDALALLVEVYRELELPHEEASALAVLEANFPQHPAFDATGQFAGGEIQSQNRSLRSVVTFGLLADEGEKRRRARGQRRASLLNTATFGLLGRPATSIATAPITTPGVTPTFTGDGTAAEVEQGEVATERTADAIEQGQEVISQEVIAPEAETEAAQADLDTDLFAQDVETIDESPTASDEAEPAIAVPEKPACYVWINGRRFPTSCPEAP